MAVTSSCQDLAFELRDTLKRKYGLSDGGSLSWHLGMNIAIKKGDYAHISQTGYIDSVAARFGMDGSKVSKTPMSETT